MFCCVSGLPHKQGERNVSESCYLNKQDNLIESFALINNDYIYETVCPFEG